MDFLCSETTRVPTRWTERSFERYFLLLSRVNLGFQAIHPGEPASIAEMSEWLSDGRAKVGTSLTVPGIGPVTAVAKLPNWREGVWSYVLAAPASGCKVEFRFLLATVLDSRQIIVKSIPSIRLGDGLNLEAIGEEECSQVDPCGTRTGPTPTFAVAPIERAWDDVDFVRVLAEEGDGRWVYLIALDESRDRLRAGSLLLATNIARYGHCSTSGYPPQVVPVSMEMHPFQATVEIEPAHFGNLEVPAGGGIEAGVFDKVDSQREGAMRTGPMRLLWRAADGFVLEPTGGAPAELLPPRFVVIDNAGNISLHTPKGKLQVP